MSDEPKNRIAEWRAERGLSQAQLAERCNTSQAQINRLEKSQRRLTHDWMTRLATALEVHPSDLVPDLAPKLDPSEEQLLRMYRGLSEADRARFLSVAEALTRDQERENGQK